jgi:Ca2+/Na+ antiporter
MELTLGEIFGNGMFVFAFTSGIVAILYPFSVDPAEHTRDCLSYLASILILSLMMSDGIITAVEGLFLILAYSAYVVLVLNFDTVKPEPETMRAPPRFRRKHPIYKLKSHAMLWGEEVAHSLCGQTPKPQILHPKS